MNYYITSLYRGFFLIFRSFETGEESMGNIIYCCSCQFVLH